MLFNKKFDLVISLGEDCACTSYLRRYNLQDYSYSFDWYLQIFIFKFIKVFIKLIPNCDLHHSLKKTWSYNFFRNKL